MMFRARRPSRISDMPAIAKPRWIRKGYEGMTFFGHIITHCEQDAAAFNRSCSALKHHEMIHLYQARSTHDSWLCFYARYLYYWLTASRYHRRLRHAGYLLNPFELEAYAHMHDPAYPPSGDVAVEWKNYAKMSMAERFTHYASIMQQNQNNMQQNQKQKNLVH